jgi:uncharacterized protein involved in exopolysaccharide biosynthesis
MSDILMIVSRALVRLRARRLPTALALRMEEEWLGELNSITGGPAKLAFAVALLLTRRQAFVVPGEETVVTVYDRPSLGSRKSLIVLSTLVFAIAAYGASFLQPVKYESTALLVSQERDDLVLRQARSNTLFETVVKTLKLEPRERMIEDLNNNTTIVPLIDPSSSSSSFLVKYRADDPAIAQRVTSTIAGHLIELNMQRRMGQLFEEASYLQGELERLADRVRLKDAELAEPGASGTPKLEHELLVSSYKALFTKHQEAEMAAMRQQPKFEVLDPPQLGSRVGPSRVAYAGIGGLAGLVLAAAAVVGRGRRQPPALTSPA